MAVFKFSTALRNLRLGKTLSVTDAGSQISFENGASTISDTQSRFLDTGFRPGDTIVVTNANVGGNNQEYTVTSVASTGASMVVSPAPSDEAAAAGTPTVALNHPGKSLAHAMRYGIIYLYDGTMPDDADSAEGCNILAKITISSATLTAGTLTNGLYFDEPSAGVIDKPSGSTWSGVGLYAGTCTWGALYDNAIGTGADTTYIYPRIFGNAGLSGAAFLITDLDIAVGIPVTCNQFQLTEGNA